MDSPLWPEPVRILSQESSPRGFVTAEAVGVNSSTHFTTTLPTSAWDAIQQHVPAPTFAASPRHLQLALEAERLRRAYTADPLLAANSARIHLLPHQMEAVYAVMLPQSPIRHLLAHDAGAGKTIMGGLLFRELQSREPNLRTLIVAPAALTVQWQRELSEKFLVEFQIVDRGSLQNDPAVWTSSARLITSIPFARQTDVVASLASVPWDLVIVDEAHHMAAYEKTETLAYRLGRILSRNTKHLVLATATPHKGDPKNFLRLLQLLDADIHDPAIVNHREPGQRGNPLMLRRLKEEMVDFDGLKLFKPRKVATRVHSIGKNPPEMALYTELTEYIDKTYRAAEKAGGLVKVNTEFAMVLLQRRMASSFAALERSLLRRRDALLNKLAAPPDVLSVEQMKDQTEADRWKQEEAVETASPAQTQQEREKEALQLDLLLAMLSAVRATGIETKVEEMRAILDETSIAPGNGEKLLVFTEFKDTLDFLRRFFEGLGYIVTQIDGSMPHDLRRKAEADFADHCQIMVATEAAGEGINLQFCAYMVNYDLPWIPTRLEQRMGRIHRYGQKRVAHIYNMVAADTREGAVLAGLLERLDEMRLHLGDQVYDVVSELVGDEAVYDLLKKVALSPATDASQDRALLALNDAIQQGETRYKQWEEHPFAISAEQFRQMQEVSRQSRLTPEYAQHFFVDALTELNEAPQEWHGPGISPGDADVLGVRIAKPGLAHDLGLDPGRHALDTFRQEHVARGVNYLALGTPLLERTLALAASRWGGALLDGALFVDVDLAPGDSYLLWFFAVHVRDGMGRSVQESLFAVKQTADGFVSARASSLTDLVSARDRSLPEILREWATDPKPAVDWSIACQQIPFLNQVAAQRAIITDLRRKPMLADADAALRAAQETFDDAVFEDADSSQPEARLQAAQARRTALTRRFEHEAACSLGVVRVLTVAAVLALVDAPQEDLADDRPEIAKKAQELAVAYELKAKRTPKDVSGEHDAYPYDLHSMGPGGVRCIEVKGTTTGAFLLSENERRAAKRLGSSYYLYIVRDPLGPGPVLSIVRDPLSKMEYDDVLYSGARYKFNATTWQPTVEETVSL